MINNITYHPTMSEDIYLKAMNIIGYTKNNRNHNYTTDEIMFTLGYIALYYKKTTDYRSVG
ncbi:hypothetical protein H3N56_02375 [Cetobacterium sp. 2A]|uniref:hypothetical protein n=1 Tax=Cetobacterium sp. 2A TaxID=2754723 RepID=UPI00163C3F9A|nr:hypothetical protein [Cetobacterium sp. 2A]MBC2855335.1 hypothetical protein [Cetobacterium sp. 2A]MBC2855338.1 hypothetical protein [Cetobacterium sp. 2A]